MSSGFEEAFSRIIHGPDRDQFKTSAAKRAKHRKWRMAGKCFDCKGACGYEAKRCRKCYHAQRKAAK